MPGEKLIFVPSGQVIAAVEEGIDPKEAIELWGHDAGEFMPEDKVNAAGEAQINKLEFK